MNPDQAQKLYNEVGRVFSPSAPITSEDLFAGRKVQIARLMDVVGSMGQHAIIYGERGVGKSSLVNVLKPILQQAASLPIFIAKINCDSTDDFSSAWSKILGEIMIPKSIQLGFEKTPKEKIYSLAELIGVDKITPYEVLSLRKQFSAQFVFIFDEFDRMTKIQSSRLFADTMKSLSDNVAKITVLLVGVADNIDELIKEHASIDRSLIQVRMPRMHPDELENIIAKAMKKLGMSFEDEAKYRVVHLSQGLPHYTHSLGLAATRHALDEKRDIVEIKDVESGIKSALELASQGIIKTYHDAIRSPRKDNLFRQVLLACALSPVDELGFFAASDVRAPLSQITGRPYQIPAFIRHLSVFTTVERAKILTSSGGKRRVRFRFTNPLIQPYVVMKGITEGIISQDTPLLNQSRCLL